MGIGIISELEQINTLEDKDFMVDIALAVAQDYSRAKSNNIKFGIRQRMREGKTILHHTQFLGIYKMKRRNTYCSARRSNDSKEDI